MKERGWIKIYRTIEDSWVYSDPVIFRIWISLILMANYKPNKICVKGNIVELRRGQLFTSMRSLAMKFNLSKNTVKKKLDLLEKDHMIIVDSRNNVGTLITVLKYDTFQANNDSDEDTDWDTDKDTDWDNHLPIIEPQSGTMFDTEQEYKKEKKVKRNKEKEVRPLSDPWGNEFE